MSDLSLYDRQRGMAYVVEIITNSAGFWHAMEVCPFSAEKKALALRAWEAECSDARLWRNAKAFHEWGLLKSRDIAAIEREVPLDGKVA